MNGLGNRKIDLDEDRQVGNNDLRVQAEGIGGFRHVTLRNAGNGMVIIVNEDDVEALRDYLNAVLETPEVRG